MIPEYSLAVISDIHANAPALRAVTQLLSSRSFNQLVVLGDLLTYGCHPLETIDLLAGIMARWPVTLLSGNHDSYYRDESPSVELEIRSLPGWIQESIEWTRRQVNTTLFKSFPWRERLSFRNVLFHHSDPFGSPGWEYLSDKEIIARALQSLEDEQLLAGIFGHTHRPMLAARTSSGLFLEAPWKSIRILRNGTACPFLLNPGSLGQPRTRDRISTIMTMNFGWQEILCEIIPIHYDMDPCLRSVASSSLSSPTKEKLLSFFTPV